MPTHRPPYGWHPTLLYIVNTNTTSTNSQLKALKLHEHRTKCFYCSHHDNPGQTPLSSTPRQSITLWCIMALHQSTAVNDPTCRCHQSTKLKHIPQSMISPPSWVESRGVQYVMQFLSRREWAFPVFCSPSLHDFFRYVKSLSSWKPSFVSCDTCWNQLHISFLGLSSTLICDVCFTSICFHGGQWHQYSNCLSYLNASLAHSFPAAWEPSTRHSTRITLRQKQG